MEPNETAIRAKVVKAIVYILPYFSGLLPHHVNTFIPTSYAFYRNSIVLIDTNPMNIIFCMRNTTTLRGHNDHP